MIKVEYELYCDKCGRFIAELEKENDQYNYCSGEGYRKGNIFEYYSRKLLGPRKRNRYYKKDKKGFYYIPEVIN